MKHIKLVTQQPLQIAQSDISLAKILEITATALDFLSQVSTAVLGMFTGLVEALSLLIDSKESTR